jgi:hypothetical protein
MPSRKTGSLIEAIESIPKGERALAALSGATCLPEVDQWVPESELLDPEKPVEPDELFDYFIRPEQQPFAYRHLMKVIIPDCRGSGPGSHLALDTGRRVGGHGIGPVRRRMDP